MDSFEWNKIAGWTLAACLTVLALSIGTGMIFKPHALKTQAYVIEGVEADASATAAPAKEADKPIEFYLASASPEKGAEIFKKCAACHTITPGGAAGIGPNLYGVVGGPHAHMAGFGYSDGMAATHDKKWDFTQLNAWLTNPKNFMTGTKMAFAGLSKPEDRAAIIVYLNSQSASPLPLPPVPAEAAPAAAAAAPAADAAATPAADAVAPAAADAAPAAK